MERTVSRSERLVVIALMIALQIILTRFVSITTPFVRIGFGYLPIVAVGILYGPVWAGCAYAVGDIIGSLLFPSGAFFPGFTLSAFLTGVIYGMFFYRKELRWPRVLFAAAIVMFGINLFLNTYWLTILYGKGYLALLPGRALKELIELPIAVILILLMDRVIIRNIKKTIR